MTCANLPPLRLCGNWYGRERRCVRTIQRRCRRPERHSAATHILYSHDEYDAASDSDALLILTSWGQYGKLDLQRLRSVMKAALIFDGRNMYAPEEMAAAGFVYHSVGRASGGSDSSYFSTTAATETIRTRRSISPGKRAARQNRSHDANQSDRELTPAAGAGGANERPNRQRRLTNSTQSHLTQ